MMGLPGSGKTTYVEEHTTLKPNHRVISLDNEYYGKRDPINYAAQYAVEYVEVLSTDPRCSIDDIWIDGLILSYEDINKLVDKIIYEMSKANTESWLVFNDELISVTINIHQYECNRDNCLHNDINRYNNGERQLASNISIENTPYVVLDKNQIESLCKTCLESSENEEMHLKYVKFNLEYELLPVKKCGTWELYYKSKGTLNPNILESNSWSRGGSWCDYRGCHGTIEASDQPEFTELDNILLETCPNLPILIYKKIYKDYVTINEYSEDDYYGGTEYKANYVADMKAIYDYLREKNLIEE